jgi:hypothetical protein
MIMNIKGKYRLISLDWTMILDMTIIPLLTILLFLNQLRILYIATKRIRQSK